MFKRSLWFAAIAFLLFAPAFSGAEEAPFTPFATVVIGTHVSADDYMREIRRNAMRIGAGAANDTDVTLRNVILATSPREMTLAAVTPADLGFSGDVTREGFYARAAAAGLKFCPAEVGFALRLAYRSQPRNEHLWIAMEPIGTRSLYNDWVIPRILGLYAGNDGSLWLVSSFPDKYVEANEKIVFLLGERPSKAKLRSPDTLEFRPTKVVTFGAWGMGIHTTFGSGGAKDAYLSWLGVGTHLFRSRDDRLLAGGIGLQMIGILNAHSTNDALSLGLQVMPVSIPLWKRFIYVTPTYTRILGGNVRQRNAFGVNFTMLADFEW